MSAPLVPLVLAWIVGLLLGGRGTVGWAAWLGAAMLALVVGGAVARGTTVAGKQAAPLLFQRGVYGTLVALALTLAGARGAANRPHFGAADLATYNDMGRVTLLGTVARYPEARGSTTRYEVVARELVVEGSGARGVARGRLLVNLPPYPALPVRGRAGTEGRTRDAAYA